MHDECSLIEAAFQLFIAVAVAQSWAVTSVLPATTATFTQCKIIFPCVPHLIGIGVNINSVNIVSNLRHLAGQRAASSQPSAPRGQSRSGLMDMLVFVQDSSNCTTSDPFKIFKWRLKERQRDQVSKATVGKGCCPWPELLCMLSSIFVPIDDIYCRFMSLLTTECCKFYLLQHLHVFQILQCIQSVSEGFKLKPSLDARHRMGAVVSTAVDSFPCQNVHVLPMRGGLLQFSPTFTLSQGDITWPW